MEEFLPFIFPIGFVMLFVAAAYFSYQRDKKRKEAIKSHALQKGMKYIDSSGYMIDCPGCFNVISQVPSQRFDAIVMWNIGGAKFQIMDYKYTTGSGKHRHTHYYTLCLFSKSDVSFPGFFIRKESAFWDFLGEKIGIQDIDFAEDRIFSKKFVLKSETKEGEWEVRKFFTGKIRNAFVNYYVDGAAFEANSGYFLAYKAGVMENSQRLDFFAKSFKIFEAMTSESYG